MEKPATEKTYRIPWKIRDLGIVTAILIASLIGLNVLLFLIDAEGIIEQNPEKRSIATLWLFLAQSSLFYIPLHYGVIRKYQLHLGELGLRWIGLWRTVWWAVKGFGLVMGLNFILSALIQRIGELPGFGQQEEYVDLFGSGAFDMVIAVIVLAIIAPIIEEIFFRGFVLQTFLSRFSVPVASILTAGIFSIAHLQLGSSGIIFILGLILNWLFIHTRSLAPCIAFHMFNNVLAFAVEFLW